MPVADRVRLIDALSRTGLRRIEAASFVRAEAIPPMAGSDEVMARIDRRPGVVVLARSCRTRRAPSWRSAAKADELELVVSRERDAQPEERAPLASPSRSIAARELVDLAHGEDVPVEAIVSTAFGCPYEGDVAPERVAQLAGHLLDAGADRLSFGDTTGMATPAPRRRPARRARARGHHRRSHRPALPQHARHRARERRRRARAGRHALRRVDRRARRLSVRARRVGQRGHRGPRAHARGHGHRHRHRPRRAARLRAAGAGDRRPRAAERAPARRAPGPGATRAPS